MWLCLNNAFLSVVDKATAPGCLMVRARVAGHIEAVFPGAVVQRTEGNDYLFRAEIARGEVAARVAEAIMEIDYNNFKNSVKANRLHDAYSAVWGVMGKLQPGGPYSRGGRKIGGLF